MSADHIHVLADLATVLLFFVTAALWPKVSRLRATAKKSAQQQYVEVQELKAKLESLNSLVRNSLDQYKERASQSVSQLKESVEEEFRNVRTQLKQLDGDLSARVVKVAQELQNCLRLPTAPSQYAPPIKNDNVVVDEVSGGRFGELCGRVEDLQSEAAKHARLLANDQEALQQFNQYLAKVQHRLDQLQLVLDGNVNERLAWRSHSLEAVARLEDFITTRLEQQQRKATKSGLEAYRELKEVFRLMHSFAAPDLNQPAHLDAAVQEVDKGVGVSKNPDTAQVLLRQADGGQGIFP